MDKITKEVKESGNSGHIIVPKDWIGSDVKVIKKKDYQKRDHRTFVGLVYELVNKNEPKYMSNGKLDINKILPDVLKYGKLHHNFNATPIRKFYDHGFSLGELFEEEKQKDKPNEYILETYNFIRLIMSGGCIERYIKDMGR